MATRTKRTEVPAVDASATSPALDELTGTLPRIVEIPIDSLYPHPHNPRKSLGDLTELAASIAEQGVRQPLTVVPAMDVPDLVSDDLDTDGSPRGWVTVIGHRRAAAATLAGRTVVPAIVEQVLSPARQLELMLVENLQRADLTAIEEAEGYQGLLDLGRDVAAIVAKTGRSAATVRRRLQLVTLPKAAREKVHFHQGSLGDAELLADTLARPDVVARPELAAALTDAYGDRRDFAAFVRAQVLSVELEEATARFAADLTAKGVRVVPRPPYGDKRTKPLYNLSAVDEQYGPQITEKKHAKCPGRVVWLSSRWERVAGQNVQVPTAEEGCEDFAAHGHFDRQAVRRASSTKGAAEQRRLVIATNKAAAAARPGRLEWIRTVLLARPVMPEGSTLYVAALLRVGRVPDYQEHRVHPELLVGDGDTTTVVPAPATDAEALWHLVLHALAVAEAKMVDKSWWTKNDYRREVVARHLRYLAANGYALADVEREYLVAADKDERAAAKRAATKAAKAALPTAQSPDPAGDESADGDGFYDAADEEGDELDADEDD